MNRTIQLMNEKIHFLEKFFSLNEKQIVRLESGLFDQIESFYNQRENLLKIIKYIDAEINKYQMLASDLKAEVTKADKKMITECLLTKDRYVERILDQDIQILAMIDQAKSNIIKELKEVRNGKKAMAGYKSNVA